jgi:phosphoribosylformylglycinamidine synthase
MFGVLCLDCGLGEFLFMPPRVLIVRAPGTNCDLETAHAFHQVGAVTEALHINRLLENPRRCDEFQILCLPGGFSYGDDLAAGRILGNQIRQRLADEMQRFKAAGKLILGVCNGFQILLKSGVLLSDDFAANGKSQGHPATLTNNDSGKFEDRWVWLKTVGSKCVFFAGIERMYLPVAHAEGKFVTRDQQVLSELESAGQVVLRYTTAQGNGGPVAYPANPNGAMSDIAAICDETGRVCGLMPHPERHIDVTHHPRWTRGEGVEGGHGLRVFRNAVDYFK